NATVWAGLCFIQDQKHLLLLKEAMAGMKRAKRLKILPQTELVVPRLLKRPSKRLTRRPFMTLFVEILFVMLVFMYHQQAQGRRRSGICSRHPKGSREI